MDRGAPQLSPGAAASCLCVTEDRQAFLPWLLWNFDKQDYRNRELVVVDSSREPLELPERADLRVIRCDRGTSVAKKRNLALAAARGEFVTWFDDDDWQHPAKLSLLAEALGRRPLAGNVRSWFVALAAERARLHVWRQGLLFNSVGFLRALGAAVRFDEGRARAADTPWVLALRRAAGGRASVLDEPLFFWLSHDKNLSNPAERHRFTAPLSGVREALGEAAWGDTDEQLRALRERLTTRREPATRRAPRPRKERPRARVVVTTFNRPEGLRRLLEDIEREWSGRGLDVRVYDDASTLPYDDILADLRAHGWSYVRAAENHGKRACWRWWNTILRDLRQTDAGLYFVTQDDMRLCRDFFERSAALWSAIPDESKVSLFLHLDEHTATLSRSRWTPVRERRVGDVVHCGWVDNTAFLCERRFFDALGWRLDPIRGRRWEVNSLLGSGVGAQFSVRLHRRGLSMYRVSKSLTVHNDGRSLMNPEARRVSPMRTVRFVDGDESAARLTRTSAAVFASLASVPSRERGLAAVVEALLPQVDSLGVCLNGYRRVPEFLEDPRIRVARSQDNGDRGDAGKFFWAAKVDGYHLVCDDDLRYPADYAARLVAGIDRYERSAVVGFHGAVLKEDVADYYRSRRLLHYSQQLRTDTPVHVLGTGAAGYHSSTIAVRPEDFPGRDMADVFFALLGQRQRVPFVCLARERSWLTEIPGLVGDSIYVRALTRSTGSQSEPTRLVREHGAWTLHRAIAAPKQRPLRHGATRGVDGVGRIVRLTVVGKRRRAVLLLPDRDHITLAVRRSRTYYENDLLEAICMRARPGTFVDIGAHYGNHTVFFALECDAEGIVAVEPNPSSFEGLVANIRANGIEDRVKALRLAIHPRYRHVDLRPLPWETRRGNPARTNSGLVGVTRSNGDGDARAARLEEALAPFRSISVVKVDAGDLGPEILESGKEILERDRPLVAIAASDAKLAALDALLRPLDYLPVGRFCWTPTWLWASNRPR